ncbi:RNA polymerase sigma factor [Actinomadura verrucosospora]|uniref:Uncharacterized protein n=1 Tax=Actinomadura verrucosospora TaxID=46165 RepID=A0A7D3VNM3_ACTVE|nr:RNA polymerase sigma factor [Actinomadura verrucosospora]QKG18610.1 hypothetical protein ACTIVE_0244 [Actinomadura verrucosospora]
MTLADRELVALAVDGDQDALTEVVRRVQDPVYRLALRMTGHPSDAEDATQEILIRVLTRLAGFRGDAALVTWAYRIATNHLINLSRRPRHELLAFDGYRQDLLDGLAAPAYTGPGGELFAEEIRLLCTQALLQCLDRPGRAAYVLADVIGLSGDEAAWILDITPAAYRKRLERARRQVRTALTDRCGLLDSAAPCRCGKRITYAVQKGRLGPNGPGYTRLPTTPDVTRQTATSLSQLRDVGELLRSHPRYAAPQAKVDAVLALARSGRYPDVLPRSGAADGAADASLARLGDLAVGGGVEADVVERTGGHGEPDRGESGATAVDLGVVVALSRSERSDDQPDDEHPASGPHRYLR